MTFGPSSAVALALYNFLEAIMVRIAVDLPPLSTFNNSTSNSWSRSTRCTSSCSWTFVRRQPWRRVKLLSASSLSLLNLKRTHRTRRSQDKSSYIHFRLTRS